MEDIDLHRIQMASYIHSFRKVCNRVMVRTPPSWIARRTGSTEEVWNVSFVVKGHGIARQRPHMYEVARGATQTVAYAISRVPDAEDCFNCRMNHICMLSYR